MKVTKVIGNVWAICKEEKLVGLKLLLVQPLNVLTGRVEWPPIVAVDIIGAGMGETVLVVGGSSACSAVSDMSIPADATVVGIVGDQKTDRSVFP